MLLAALLASPGAVAQAVGPSLRVTTTAFPSHFIPGDATGADYYLVRVVNVGGAPTDGSSIAITDTLPGGIDFHPGGHGVGTDFGLAMDGGAVSDNTICQAGPPAGCATLDHATSPGGVPPVLEPDGYYSIAIPVDVDAGLDGATVTNQVTVSGGGARPATAEEQTPVGSDPAVFGFQEAAFALTDSSGNPAGAAGSHPYDLNTRFQLNSVAGGGGAGAPAASLRDVRFALPPGVVVNPQGASARCTEAELEISVPPPVPSAPLVPSCPNGSVIGIARASALGVGTVADTINVPVYNMVPPPGPPAQFAFVLNAAPAYAQIRGGLDSKGGYRLSGEVTQLTQFGGAVGVDLDLWGDPSAASHDAHRGACVNPGSVPGANPPAQELVLGSCPVTSVATPFLTMPSACSGPLSAAFSIDSYAEPGNFITALPQSAGPVVGCSALAFAPTLKAQPIATDAADSPGGMSVDLHVPQTVSKSQLATANLEKVVIDLPAGLRANPAAANGLGACPAAGVSATPPSCPDASKVGTVEIETPLLPDPISGSVYVATPYDNPLGAQFVLYALIDDPQRGLGVALAGKIESDPVSGRLRAVFDDLPQIPISDMRLELYGGSRGLLTTPAACGSYAIETSLSPWSGTAAVATEDSFSILGGPGPGCVGPLPAPPGFEAGAALPIAGISSPFVLDLSRGGGSEELGSLELTTPPGLSASLAGVGTCGEAELTSPMPNCLPDSRVGAVVVEAGSGPRPLPLEGDVYLAGAHGGAPFSLAAIVPARAGPFDLGSVLVRIAVSVDPRTAQLHLRSDPLPRIVSGIPVDLRNLYISLDRPGFIRNPTSCDEMSMAGAVFSPSGERSDVSSRFQVGECRALPFKPRAEVALSGGLGRGGHPAVRAVVHAAESEARIGSAAFTLPAGELLDLHHLQALCARDLVPGQCPDSSRLGFARLSSSLLDRPLAGPLYLQTPSHGLPDVIAEVRGEGIRLLLHGRLSTLGGQLRVQFADLPDVPLTKAVFSLRGGRHGLIVNSDSLCADHRRATVGLTAHDGRRRTLRPRLRAAC